MGTPYYHAEQSAKRFGGIPDDYLSIHELLDSSKAAVADVRHRVLTHNSWFVTTVLEKVFGTVIENSDGKKVAVREIGQWHVMEDFDGSFPTAQDFVENLEFAPWMDNGKDGAVPPSHENLPPFRLSLQKTHPSPQAPAIEVEEPDPDTSSRGCGGGGRID